MSHRSGPSATRSALIPGLLLLGLLSATDPAWSLELRSLDVNAFLRDVARQAPTLLLGRLGGLLGLWQADGAPSGSAPPPAGGGLDGSGVIVDPNGTPAPPKN